MEARKPRALCALARSQKSSRCLASADFSLTNEEGDRFFCPLRAPGWAMFFRGSRPAASPHHPRLCAKEPYKTDLYFRHIEWESAGDVDGNATSQKLAGHPGQSLHHCRRPFWILENAAFKAAENRSVF